MIPTTENDNLLLIRISEKWARLLIDKILVWFSYGSCKVGYIFLHNYQFFKQLVVKKTAKEAKGGMSTPNFLFHYTTELNF